MSMQELQAAHLPLTGWHIIEASAGTGKTYNISRIFLRLVLERRLPVDKILVMTFTRAATQELRLRINALIRQVMAEWDDSADPVVVALRERIPAQQAQLLLQRALLNLDQAAIFTINGFCQRILHQQAFNSGVSFSPVMRESSKPAILAATRDWYRNHAFDESFMPIMTRWATPEVFFSAFEKVLTSTEPLNAEEPRDIPATIAQLQQDWPAEQAQFHATIAKSKLGKPKKAALQQFQDRLAQWLASDDPDIGFTEFATDSLQLLRNVDALEELDKRDKRKVLRGLYALLTTFTTDQLRQPVVAGIEAIRSAVAADKLREDALDFSDQIEQLRLALGSEQAQLLADNILEQFPAALVDEFQDTDPSQFDILKAVYDDRGDDCFLCLIGDPKQAIYGFRGGDIFAYLNARDTADQRWGMGTNYRSSAEVVAAYNRLFNGAPLDQTLPDSVFGFEIDYQVVDAGREKPPVLKDPACKAAAQWLVLDDERDSDKSAPTKEALPMLAAACANEIARALNQVSLNKQPVTARDIAVLVRSRRQADAIIAALQARGVNAVYLSDRSSVLQSAEAKDLYRFLHGVLYNEQRGQLQVALATPWFGFDGAALYRLRDDDLLWSRWQQTIQALRDLWRDEGLMSMALHSLQQYYQPRSSHRDLELSNLIHLLEILQQSSQKIRQPAALLQWLRQQLDDEDNDLETDARLHAEQNLVRIVTMHGSKGLEYPLVYLPFVSLGGSGRKTAKPYCRYHQRTDEHAARLAILPDNDVVSLMQEEDDAESVRLLYVAATRAEVRVATFLADTDTLDSSPLGLCLKRHQDSNGAIDFSSAKQIFSQFQRQGFGQVATVCASDDKIIVNPQASLLPEDCCHPTFNGHIERHWWLASFSSLSKNLRHGTSVSRDRDQDDLELLAPAEQLPLRYRLKKGAEAGNLLHDLLERLDFSKPDFNAAMQYPRQRYAALFETFAEYELQGWVKDILSAQLLPGLSLGDLSQQQTLRECEFYFPMEAARRQPMQALADIVAAHLQAPFSLAGQRQLKGMMHGFMDLVFEWQGKYYVADYKSTWLGNRANAYDSGALADNMRHSYYDLQYLIYSLALHRYLQTRLPDYDPEQHFGGALYLYLRGMHQGENWGVYYHSVSADTLEQLDQLFSNTVTEPA